MKNLWNRLWYSLYSTLIASAIRLHWHRLWIREDEFHSSLNTDSAVILHLEEATWFTRRMLGFISRDEYARDLHFRRTIKSNERLYYSYSDLRIRSFIAAWHAFRTHIPGLRFGDFFREIDNLRHEYQRESERLLEKALQKHQEALLSGDRWAWFWTDMRAFRDYFFLDVTVLGSIYAICIFLISGMSTRFFSLLFDVQILGILCLVASIVPFLTVFVLRDNHRTPHQIRRPFRYFCSWL